MAFKSYSWLQPSNQWKRKRRLCVFFCRMTRLLWIIKLTAIVFSRFVCFLVVSLLLNNFVTFTNVTGRSKTSARKKLLHGVWGFLIQSGPWFQSQYNQKKRTNFVGVGIISKKTYLQRKEIKKSIIKLKLNLIRIAVAGEDGWMVVTTTDANWREKTFYTQLL